MLSTNAYIRPFAFAFALDVSRAFDTVRHAMLMEKMVKLVSCIYHTRSTTGSEIFLTTHSLCTKYSGEISDQADIHTSVIQESGLGLVSFLVMAADLELISDKNRMIKFADDTYLIVPEECTSMREDKLAHIQDWTQGCSLSLNCTKTNEIIFRAQGRRGSSKQLPDACPGIERVKQLAVLGVIINDRMTAADHVSRLFETCMRRLYVLHVPC